MFKPGGLYFISEEFQSFYKGLDHYQICQLAKDDWVVFLGYKPIPKTTYVFCYLFLSKLGYVNERLPMDNQEYFKRFINGND